MKSTGQRTTAQSAKCSQAAHLGKHKLHPSALLLCLRFELNSVSEHCGKFDALEQHVFENNASRSKLPMTFTSRLAED